MNHLTKKLALASLSLAVSVPMVMYADGWKRTPDRPEPTPYAMQAWEKAVGHTKKAELNFTPIDKVDFNPEGVPSRYVPLVGATVKKAPSFVQKARQSRAAAYLGNIYGVVNSAGSKSYWGKVDFNNFSVSPLLSGDYFANTGDLEHQTGAVRNGILYIPQGIQSSVRDFDVIWKRIDISTGARLKDLEFGSDAKYWVQAMCYDPVSDCFFGMAGNDEGSEGIVENRIVKIDPSNNFKADVLADKPNGTGLTYCGFFYHPGEKEIYAYREDGRIDIVNRYSGIFTESGQIECGNLDEEMIVLAPFTDRGTTNIVFSPKDEMAFLFCQDVYHNNESYVYSIDLNSGGYCERVGEIPGNVSLVSLYCPDTFALPEAPNVPELNDFSLVKDALNGTFSFKAPTTYFNELKLTADMTAVALLDGKEIYRQTIKPGESTPSIPFTVDKEGLYELEVRCDLSENLTGAPVVKRFYAGNDTPLAPTDVNVTGNTITWTAPGGVGVNRGYVDTEDLTYNVYFNEDKLNSTPVKGTSFEFEVPAALRLVSVTVEAVAHNKISDKSDAYLSIVGNSLPLPYAATPTLNQAALYTVVDANHDGMTYIYDSEDKAFAISLETYQGSNDYLVLPRLFFPDAAKMYHFSCSFRSQTPYYGSETMEIWVGKDPENLDTKVFEYPHLEGVEANMPIECTFSVPEAGDYYIGVRAHTDSECSGAVISNISVEQLASSTKVPGSLTDIKMEAGASGSEEAIFTFKAPEKAVDGTALSGNVKVSVSNVNDPSNVAEVSVAPGAEGKVTCKGEKGFNTYRITTSNDAGEGLSQMIRGYIGLDTPDNPKNMKSTTSEDNLTMRLEWDPVTKGINGGFIDPETVKYQVWYNSSGVTWNRVGNPVDVCAATFDPQYTGLARWRVTVMAQNRDGDFVKSNRVNALADQLGNPVTLPLLEDFATGGNAYPWSYLRDTDATEMSSFRTSSNSDIATLGIGNPKCDDGSGRVLSSLIYGQATEARLLVPKFSTIGMNNPVFNVKLWNYQYAPKMEIYARMYGQEECEKIATVEVDPERYNEWNDYMLPLPDKYKNKSWVQIQIHFYLPSGGSSYGVMDYVRVFENVDYDYKISSLTCDDPESFIGDRSEFVVQCTNGGLEDGEAHVSVSVKGVKGTDETLLANEQFDITRFRSFRTMTRRVAFHAKSEWMKYDKVIVRATITGEGDNITNNNVKEITWDILDSNTPYVTDLAGEWNEEHNAPKLTWSQPDMTYGNVDDFEYLPAFSIDEKLGQWQNYDEDGFPTFSVSGLTENWPYTGEPRAWQVINAKDLGVADDVRLRAHSGNQYLGAFAGWDPMNDGDQVQVADWLISPEVVGGTRVYFWMNHISTDYRETIHVMYSTTDTEIESFYKLCNRSKSGTESWEQTYFDLPENAKYFALKYVGWNTLGVLVDDIEFTPVNLTNWALEGFDVYRKRDGEASFTYVGTTSDLSYVDTECGDANVNYYIVTRAKYNDILVKSPASNEIRLFALGVDELENILGVAGDYSAISFSGLEGKHAYVYTIDGKLVNAVNITSEDFRAPAEPGIYLVKVGEVIAKVVVK